jgi:hypothetical protein
MLATVSIGISGARDNSPLIAQNDCWSIWLQRSAGRMDALLPAPCRCPPEKHAGSIRSRRERPTQRTLRGKAGPTDLGQDYGGRSLSISLSIKGRQEFAKGSRSGALGGFFGRMASAPQSNGDWLAVAVNLPLPPPRVGNGLPRHDMILVRHPLRLCDSSMTGASPCRNRPPWPAPSPI